MSRFALISTSRRPALMTFRTAWATAQDAGLPPKVLKWRMRLPNASITSGRNSAPTTQMAVAHELADRDEVGQFRLKGKGA